MGEEGRVGRVNVEVGKALAELRSSDKAHLKEALAITTVFEVKLEDQKVLEGAKQQ